MKPRTSSATAGVTPGMSSASPEAVLGDLLDQRIEKVVSLFARALTDDDPEAVHDLRVWSRRLQQGLDGAHSKPRPKRVRRLRRTIRRVRRALGEWRNYDVVLQSLERRRKATRSAPKRRLWAAVIDVLRARRVDEIRRARRKLGRIDLAKLAASIGHVARSGDDPALLRASIAGAVAEAWNGWRESLERAEGQRDPLSVHALRVATKRVRYGMELARHLGDESAEPAIAWLKRLQQALGEWHDEIVLRRLVAEAVARPDWLLEESDIARLALAELERDRGRVAAGVEEILRLANDLAGRDATQGWIDAAAVAAPRPAP